jgi:hypothetical protein
VNLKQHSCRVEPVDLSAVPADVLEIVAQHGQIVTAKKFVARNLLKKTSGGYVFQIDKPLFVVVQSGQQLFSRANPFGVPAWGVMITGDGQTPEEVVDGLFCHTVVKVGGFSRNVPVRKPASTAVAAC